jgi:hypothetical protein
MRNAIVMGKRKPAASRRGAYSIARLPSCLPKVLFLFRLSGPSAPTHNRGNK